MTGQLLELGAGVALLLWGLTVLRSSVLGATAARLAAGLPRVAVHRPAALALGVVAGAAVPAGSLLTQMLGAPLAGGTLAAAIGLAVMLGAEAGAAVTTLVLAAPLPGTFELLTLAGVALVLGWRQTAAARLGQGLLGLALALMALRLLGPVAAALAQEPVLSALVAALDGDTLLALTLGAGAAIVLRSSTAAVLLLVLLCSAGVLALTVALPMMLGANLGSGILALAASAGGPAPPRQVATGLLVFKLLAVAGCVAVLHGSGAAGMAIAIDAGLVLAGAHLLFNAASALAFAGLTSTMNTLVARWTSGHADARGELVRLDPRALPVPSVALTCAAREVVRMADQVELMLGGMLQVFLLDDQALARSVRAMDDAVDTCYREVKHYLAAIEREGLSPDEERRWSELMSFAIALEQVADTVERVLRDLESRRPASRGKFPGAAIAEVCGLHAMLMHDVRLAVNLLLQREPELAQALVAADGGFLDLARCYEASHLQRLAAGEPGSSAISAVYIDLLSDFERMNTLVCSLGSCFLRLRGQGSAAAPPPREPPAARMPWPAVSS